MDKNERGLLLVEQEDAKQDVVSIKKKLNVISKNLSSLALALNHNSEEIHFSNLPEQLRECTFNTRSMPSCKFDWNEINKIEEIVTLIDELHKNNSLLRELQLKLHRP